MKHIDPLLFVIAVLLSVSMAVTFSCLANRIVLCRELRQELQICSRYIDLLESCIYDDTDVVILESSPEYQDYYKDFDYD